MKQNKYRAQILLEPDQHAALAERARQEERSLSDLVRQIVQEWMLHRDEAAVWQKRKRALDQLRQIREEVEQEHGVYQGNLLEESLEGKQELKGLPSDDQLKDIIKQAISELVVERKELFRELIEEAIEDAALSRAIQDGKASEPASREAIFQILDGQK